VGALDGFGLVGIRQPIKIEKPKPRDTQFSAETLKVWAEIEALARQSQSNRGEKP
jgi:hypothetical protein